MSATIIAPLLAPAVFDPPASASDVKMYPVAPDAKVSLNYTATVDGRPAYIEHISGFAGGDVSWLSFDFRGSVTVSVTALRNVETVEVCPKSAGIVAELEGNTATLTITEPCRLFLKWDDGFELPFHIFSNAMEESAPEPNTPGVHYFGPGVHYREVLHLQSDETLYLAGGATVHAPILVQDAERVSIRGRGIICGSHIHRYSKETYEVDGTQRDMVAFHNCRDVKIEGVTILDSHHWTLTFWNCERVHVSNVKICNERNFSTDGMVPVNCSDVLIEDCFIRSKDDCITIKGLDDRYPDKAARPIRNIVVQNCVFWSDNNNGVVVGSETKACTISEIIFRNLDFVRVSNTCGDFAGALAIICLHDTDMSGIIFENIRIEHSTAPYFNFFYTDSIFRIPGERQTGGGRLRDILLKDISVTGGPLRSAYITGMHESRYIENVRIEKFEIHGRRVHSAAEGRIRCNEFTRNIHIS
jgi:Glycosyl hydrolases family 28